VSDPFEAPYWNLLQVLAWVYLRADAPPWGRAPRKSIIEPTLARNHESAGRARSRKPKT
jgi:hypothetical protein